MSSGGQPQEKQSKSKGGTSEAELSSVPDITQAPTWSPQSQTSAKLNQEENQSQMMTEMLAKDHGVTIEKIGEYGTLLWEISFQYFQLMIPVQE